MPRTLVRASNDDTHPRFVRWGEGAVYYSDQAFAGDDGVGACGEAGTDSNHSLLQKFKEFIRNFETANNVFPYRETLLHNPKFLLVDTGDLDTFDFDLSAKIRSSLPICPCLKRQRRRLT